MQLFQKYWDEKPLTVILWLAILLRVIAVIFSRGYGMHDDHFLVIETAQSWLDGADYNNWFRESENQQSPTILSFIYAGIHYLIFAFLQLIGIFDPQAKMFFVRLLHAGFSLITIVYGYKLTEKLSGKSEARIVGLLLTAYWFMPFFAVRNLVEVICIPFLMIGFWLLINEESKKHRMLSILFSGLLFGIAFSFRFQTAVMIAGVGLVLLFHKQWKEVLIFGAGTILSVLLLHGLPDFIIWGYPFAEIREYISHNIEHRLDYHVAPWYNYILVIAGFLVPPVSFFLIFGFLRSWRKHLLIFLPSILFIIFHSYFPNKQERFIIPVVPFVIILGIIGWQKFVAKSGFWQKNKKLLFACWAFFWVLNITLLGVYTTMYSKKARVEAMYQLYRYQDVNAIMVEETTKPDVQMLPMFYSGQWPELYQVCQKYPLSDIPKDVFRDPVKIPQFVLFIGDENLENRVQIIRQLIPGLIFESKADPGFTDHILHKLNPVNANIPIYVYRNDGVFKSN